MKNGKSKINQKRALNDKKIDYLLKNSFNHSNYYQVRNHRKRPLENIGTRASISNYNFNIPLNYNNFQINNGISLYDSYLDYNIKDTSKIINNLRNTIKKVEKVLNKNNSNILTDESKPNIISKSLILKKNKKNSKKKSRENANSKSVPFMVEDKYNENRDEKHNLNKLENDRSQLMKKNIDIRKKNMILETEINNYKNQIYSRRNINSNMKNYLPSGNENYRKYKLLLQSSLNESTSKLDKLFQLFQINEEIKNQIENDTLAHNPLFKKVEYYNHENAKIQIINQENKKKLKNLQNEQNELIKKREQLNLYLLDLKNSGKNYNMIYGSINSKVKDTADLINKLNNNKIILEEELNKITEKINRNTNIIYKNKRKVILYNNTLKNKKEEIYNYELEKRKFKFQNAQIKKGIIDMNNELNSKINNNYLISIGLKDKYNKMKYINNEKKKQLKQKEKEVENLKRITNNFDGYTNIKYPNPNYLINNNIMNQNLENEIQSIIQENESLSYNINNLIAFYENQTKQKDIIIQNLENYLNSNQKNINNNSYRNKYNQIYNNKDNENNYNYNILKNPNQIQYSNELNKKYDDTNIIYNRLNNLHEPKNSEFNYTSNDELNNKYFDSKKEENNQNKTSSNMITDEGKATDLDEILRKNNQINDIQNLNIDNFVNNNSEKEPTKVVKKETDDLGEIANQIEEYNQSNRQSSKKPSHIEHSDSNNPINSSRKEQIKENNEEKNEIDNPNLEEIENNENKNLDNVNQNNIEGQSNEQINNDENNENDQECMEIIDNYNDDYYNNINDINNEYENYDEEV